MTIFTSSADFQSLLSSVAASDVHVADRTDFSTSVEVIAVVPTKCNGTTDRYQLYNVWNDGGRLVLDHRGSLNPNQGCLGRIALELHVVSVRSSLVKNASTGVVTVNGKVVGS